MKITKYLLEEYINKEREIEILEKKLNYYARKKIPSVHGVVQSSMHSYPYAQTHVVVSGSDIKSETEYQNALKQKIIELAEKKRHFDELELIVDDAIEEIPNIEIRQIVQYKYLFGYTDAEIGEKMGLERSSISKKLTRFFESCENPVNA